MRGREINTNEIQNLGESALEYWTAVRERPSGPAIFVFFSLDRVFSRVIVACSRALVSIAVDMAQNPPSQPVPLGTDMSTNAYEEYLEKKRLEAAARADDYDDDTPFSLPISHRVSQSFDPCMSP